MLRGITAYMRRHHIALLALFFALGGSAFAAGNALLPKNSVGTAQLKNGAVIKAKIAKKTLAQLKGNRGAQGTPGAAGPQGPGGPQGPQGVQGPAGSPDTPDQVRDKLVATGGSFRVSAGTSNWRPLSPTAPLAFTYFGNATFVVRSAIGSDYIGNHLAIATALYGKTLSVKGLTLCYTASASASLASVILQVTHYTNGGTGSSFVEPVADGTAHSDSTCRVYSFAPVALTALDDVSVFVQGNWTTAGATLQLGEASLLLGPGTVDATAAARQWATRVAPRSAAATAINHP